VPVVLGRVGVLLVRDKKFCGGIQSRLRLYRGRLHGRYMCNTSIAEEIGFVAELFDYDSTLNQITITSIRSNTILDHLSQLHH
jgi:hypothetical protein